MLAEESGAGGHTPGPLAPPLVVQNGPRSADDGSWDADTDVLGTTTAAHAAPGTATIQVTSTCRVAVDRTRGILGLVEARRTVKTIVA